MSPSIDDTTIVPKRTRAEAEANRSGIGKRQDKQELDALDESGALPWAVWLPKQEA